MTDNLFKRFIEQFQIQNKSLQIELQQEDAILKAITMFKNDGFDHDTTLAAHFADVYLCKLKRVKIQHFENNYDQILSEAVDGGLEYLGVRMLFVAMIMLCLKKTDRFQELLARTLYKLEISPEQLTSGEDVKFQGKVENVKQMLEGTLTGTTEECYVEPLAQVGKLLNKLRFQRSERRQIVQLLLVNYLRKAFTAQ